MLPKEKIEKDDCINLKQQEEPLFDYCENLQCECSTIKYTLESNYTVEEGLSSQRNNIQYENNLVQTQQVNQNENITKRMNVYVSVIVNNTALLVKLHLYLLQLISGIIILFTIWPNSCNDKIVIYILTYLIWLVIQIILKVMYFIIQRKLNPMKLIKTWIKEVYLVWNILYFILLGIGHYILIFFTTCLVSNPIDYFYIFSLIILRYLQGMYSLIRYIYNKRKAKRNALVTHLLELKKKNKKQTVIVNKIPKYRYDNQLSIVDINVYKQSTNQININKFRIMKYITKQLRAIKNKSYFKLNIIKDNNKLPIIKIQANETTCSICLMEYHTNDILNKLNCNHHFHIGCMHTWLINKASCPICRCVLG